MSSNHHPFPKSTSLKHCDYHENEGELEICFQSGATYRYKCDKSEYDALKQAASPGGHFQKHIRSKYKHIT